jgi:hypothetical protein
MMSTMRDRDLVGRAGQPGRASRSGSRSRCTPRSSEPTYRSRGSPARRGEGRADSSPPSSLHGRRVLLAELLPHRSRSALDRVLRDPLVRRSTVLLLPREEELRRASAARAVRVLRDPPMTACGPYVPSWNVFCPAKIAPRVFYDAGVVAGGEVGVRVVRRSGAGSARAAVLAAADLRARLVVRLPRVVRRPLGVLATPRVLRRVGRVTVRLRNERGPLVGSLFDRSVLSGRRPHRAQGHSSGLPLLVLLRLRAGRIEDVVNAADLGRAAREAAPSPRDPTR